MAEGIAAHKVVEDHLRFDQHTPFGSVLNKIEQEQHINYQDKEKSEIIEYWATVFKNFFDSPEYRSIKKRVIEVERSFMVKIGKYWVAGTVDVMIKGKNKDQCVIDWKTGIPKTQFEMDNGYEPRIYIHAVRKGTFFVKPEKLESGMDYGKSYKKTMQKNEFGNTPEFIYGYLQDFYPAKRKSKKKPAHHSSQAMANEEGFICLEKGDKRGPGFYQTKVAENLTRLEYSLSCAVFMARAGMFPEVFGPQCKNCPYFERCESTASTVTDRQEAMRLMDNLGIQPD